MKLTKSTTVKEAFKDGKRSFYEGVPEYAPRALNWYARKEWLRGWQKGYQTQLERVENGLYA